MEKMSKGGFLIGKIQRLSERIFSKILKDNDLHEINPAQGRILFVLWEKDKISINELAQKASLGKSTLTSMLDRLEKADFVKRIPSPTDRRKILIKRTEKDVKFQDIYIKVSEEMNKLFYKGFSGKEINEFEGYLERSLENLVKYMIKNR
jgi:DNA-binding MarR family transcriptional regulator